MSGQEMHIEARSEQTTWVTRRQASRLQSDALVWGLRALRHAHGLHFDLDDADGPCEKRNQKRVLRMLSEHISPFYKSAPPTSIGGMVAKLPQIEKRLAAIELPSCASDLTITALAENVGLSEFEREFLRFKAAWSMESMLQLVFNTYFNVVSVRDLLEVLAAVLGISMEKIRETLHPQGFLYRSRLLKLNSNLDNRFHCSMEDRLLVRAGLLQILETANGDFGRLIRTLALPIPAEGLSKNDFAHLENEWSLVLGFLQGSTKGRHKGANVLLHGIPGVGKTEFARALIRASDASGLEIKSTNLENEIFNPDQRRDHFFLVSELLSRNPETILIFDDADGSLGCRSLREQDNMFTSKAALNAMLESNPLPTIWILNEISDIDPAVLRRFDVTIEFRRPAAAVMLTQLEKQLTVPGITQDWVQKVSRTQNITPAIVSRLRRLSDRLGDQHDIEQALTNSLKMSGIHVPVKHQDQFHRSYCNTEPQLETMCGFLEKSSSSRLLLHGPTGTGKTALAKHLADSVNLTPRLVRPSDLLGSYVGQTEHNIARLFGESDPQSELIILDEFESLAEDRRGARHGWEISKVAELLSQLDEYEGRVIACTNLLGNVDPAIRRRFHLKVLLGGLRNEQKIEVIEYFALQLDLPLPINLADYLDDMDNLAFGHIRNVVKVAEYTSDLNWQKFHELLVAELEGTEGRAQRRIGFRV